MRYRASRRQFLAGSAAAVAVFPMPAIAQNAPLKIGLLSVKTGPLAAGGIHFEEGISSFLKDKNFTLSGRKIDLIVADRAVTRLAPKTRRRRLSNATRSTSCSAPSPRSNCSATVDYLAQAKMPTLAFAGAEDVTQRKANPYLTRTSYTSAQGLYPLAEYVINEMKLTLCRANSRM